MPDAFLGFLGQDFSFGAVVGLDGIEPAHADGAEVTDEVVFAGGG
jgi:hypothetical protein